MALPRVFASAFNLVKSGPLNYNSCKVIPRYFHLSNCAFADRLYTDKHEWVEVSGKVGIIGISQYAQEALGDVVYAQLPDVDTDLKQKDECGALESVKAASEIYSPISGRVVEKNSEVEEKPSLINSSCYDKGWLFKVEIKDESEITKLMTEDQYKEFLKTVESH
ncbi:unnamed protein product [Psylliodes chrysocephalus]|uniref:Glycine cleavage system H protein n=1 Tax=Psylliodes chrysocephalus TaxID=3402493 RepID=A0A9P0GCI5_9CUCU|nr:unnamed protein product [Psylliodes chrysocephala]